MSPGARARQQRADLGLDGVGKAASVVTRMAGESGPCSAWVTRSSGDEHRVRWASARTIPSDGTGRQVDPDLAADLDLGRGHPGVPGADDPVDRIQRAP